MADGTPVTYEDLTDELKKKYDEVKAILEADLIGSFHRTRSHGIRWKGSRLMVHSMDRPLPRRKNAPGPDTTLARMETRAAALVARTQEAAPRDRLRHDGKRYVTKEK
ncbi:hypothetical protein QYE76_047834 [Lolium multiflorum]|uniref:Uncharacterized protein n=1 Tax=Lolium multiflorum TaxID=4521 RepID=A0AAD8X1Y1_LOLMU|nr:hypothetical protein QYE76_047834 [Lolium multiflorum]